MGDCKNNMSTTSKATESFLDKFKNRLLSKKSKAKKEVKTFVDLLAELNDAIDKLRVTKSEEAAEAFATVLDETCSRADSLVSTKERDLDTESDKFHENLQKLSILKEIRHHVDASVELAVLQAEKSNKKSEILEQIKYHVGEAAELSIGYNEVA